MQTVHLHAVVPKDRRLEISLPLEIPEGPADMLLIVETVREGQSPDAEIHAMRSALERLRSVRERTAGKQIRLSDAVIEERRAEG